MHEKTFTKVIRILFAIVLLVFGVNIFFPFMPAPEISGLAGEVLGALAAAKYVFPVMAITFIIAGLLFLFNKCSALAAILIVPFSLNFVLFHIFVEWTGWYMAFIFAIFNLILVVAYRDKYMPMLR